MPGSFFNFVKANNLKYNVVLSFPGPDLTPNSLSLPVIDQYRSFNLLTLSEREAFSSQNGVTSSRVHSPRSSSIMFSSLGKGKVCLVGRQREAQCLAI